MMPTALPSYCFPEHIIQSPWIIQGLVREHQITALGGAFNRGKSPITQDLMIHTINGLDWCGRKCEKRPVIAFDFETQEYHFQLGMKAACQRLNRPLPKMPEEFIPLLARANKNHNPYTPMLHAAITSPGHGPKLNLLRNLLDLHPTALITADPITLLFTLDSNKQTEILNLYTLLRSVLDDYPKAGMLDTFNLRKHDRKGEAPDLLTDPHRWLEEICGHLDLMNRCDIRLGLDWHMREEEVRVINGVVRGEACQPILLKPIITGFRENASGTEDPIYAGWQRVTPDDITIKLVLPAKMLEQWLAMPKMFKYSDVVPKLVPKATFSRLFRRANSLGMLAKDDEGNYYKVLPDGNTA